MSLDVQATRVRNLRSLHGRPEGFGAPTSKYFIQHLNNRGTALTEAVLSEIYHHTRPISDYLALQIEIALKLPQGWLSTDHAVFYQLDAGDTETVRQLFGLPIEIKRHVCALIASIDSTTAK